IGSTSTAPAAQNIPAFVQMPDANPPAAMMQRGGQCRPASWPSQEPFRAQGVVAPACCVPAEGNPQEQARAIRHAGLRKAGQALGPLRLGYVQGVQERETALELLRGLLGRKPET